jgi:hypothetical protein
MAGAGCSVCLRLAARCPFLELRLPRGNLIGEALAGEVNGDQVLAPGPGHSPADRSLSVKAAPDAPEGFFVHSFAGDDPIACRDQSAPGSACRSGNPTAPAPPRRRPRPNGKAAAAKPYSPTVANFVYRDQEGRPVLGVQRTADKDFFQSHWEGETWKPGAPKGPKLPYRLPELSGDHQRHAELGGTGRVTHVCNHGRRTLKNTIRSGAFRRTTC